MSTTTESASASETKISEEGTQIKGKDFVLISAPEICFSCPAEDTELTIKSYGDGLFYFGGDLYCTYPILGTTITDTAVVFDYAPYMVTVSWTNSGDGVRINPTWQRQYKT